MSMLLAASAARGLIYTYENTSSDTIPEVTSSDADCNTNAALERTFVVSDSFTVATIALGLNVSHTSRGQIRAILNAPDGSSQVFVTQTGTSGGDTDDNYDILLSTNSEGALDDGDVDPTDLPYYNRIVTQASANFYGGNASGTWTLRVCDRYSAGGLGTFNRAYLMLGSAASAAASCTATTAYDWGNLGGTGVNPTPLSGNPVTVGGITISQTSTADYAGTGGTGGSLTFAMRTTTNGNHSGYYSLIMDASGGGTDDNEVVGLQSIIGFSVPVRDLAFQLLDVDITGGSWEDQIQLIGTDAAGNLVPYTLTPVGTADLAGDLAEGDSAAATTSTDGNLEVVFQGSVASLTLNYTQGSDPAADNNQMVIGLSDFDLCGFDYGDAPNTYGTVLSGGARHVLGNRELWLGANRPDGEIDGAPGAASTTDDTTTVGGVDDEDGVASFPICPHTGSYSVTVSASDVRTAGSDGTIRGYIDWNRDGDFLDAGEMSAATTVARTNADPTSYAISWSSVPSNCGGTTSTYARFRYSTDSAAVASPTGQAPDGEIEDYQIPVNTLPVTLAWVASEQTAKGLVVRWATATETAHVGFQLWGVGGDGRRTLLGRVASESSESFVPRHYEVVVRQSAAQIELEDVGLDGSSRWHGPFTVGEAYGAEPEPDRLDWEAIRAANQVPSPLDRMRAAEGGHPPPAATGAFAPATSALLLVRQAGIHRVTHEDLLAAGVDLSRVKASTITILDHGVPVPRYLGGVERGFGPGSFIELVAEPRLTLDSPFDVYVLQAGSRVGAAAPTLLDAPRSAKPGEVATTLSHHLDRQYSFASPNADPWLDQAVLAWGAPASLVREFDLPDLVTGRATLDVALWGYGDFGGSEPDHHVVVRLNGVEILDERFDGVTAFERRLEVGGLLFEHGNQLELVVPGDTAYPFDYVAFEGFDVHHTRRATAIDGRFAGTLNEATAVDGFADGSPVVVWSRTPSGSTARAELRPQVGAVTVPAGGAVHLASTHAIRRPAIVGGVPAPRASATAEVVVISHPTFDGGLDGLVALQQARGLSTEVVMVDGIYAAYSDHAPSIDAIRSFVAATLARRGTRYVLLVGAASSDPHDHLGLGSISFVPTDYVSVGGFIHFSPTDETLADRDRDGVADVPIGRLPVRTPAELATIVDKLAHWEANVRGASPEALFVAGGGGSDPSLQSTNLILAGSLAGWSTSLAEVDGIGSAATRAAVLAALNAGMPLVSYVGHASIGEWDFDPLLRWQDADALANQARPNLVTQWACWNSYTVEPAVESLSARLLRAEGGAAGVIGAATLTSEASHRLLGELFFARVGAGAATVGEAFQGAKRDLARLGGGADAIVGMTLLGDPAMSLPAP